MNPSLIRLDDESPFTSPTPVGQPLGEPVALTRTAAHRPLADGNGVTGIWECTPGRFRRQVEQAEYSYIVSGEGRFTPPTKARPWSFAPATRSISPLPPRAPGTSARPCARPT